MYKNEELLNNSSQIKSIRDFVSFDNADKNVFVCLVGEAGSYIEDIKYMDNTMRRTTAYNRLSSLPAIPPDKTSLYDSIYTEWVRGYRNRISSPSAAHDLKMQERLSDSLKTVIDIFSITKKYLSDSMEKNFSMKMIYWYDFAVHDLVGSVQYVNGLNIVGVNVTKIQEYLFYYMTALSGAHVLLLQNKADIDVPVIRLNLSSRTILGHLGNSVIPSFDADHTGRSSSNRFMPPVFNRRTSPNAGSPYNDPAAQRQPQSYDRPYGTQSYNSPVQRQPQSYGGRTPSSAQYNSPAQRQPQSYDKPYGTQSYNSPVQRQSQSYDGAASGQSFRRAPEQNTTGNIKMKIPPRPDRHKKASVQSAAPISSSGESVRVKLPPRAPSVYVPYDNGFGFESDRSEEKTYEQIAQLAVSVVQIFAVQREYPNSDKVRILGSGSGIVISSMGHILTNHHVAKASREYMIRVENDDTPYFTNRLIKYHTDLDLAIIQIDKKLTPIRIYDGKKPLVRGQNVVAIGSPQGLFNTVSNGIISGFREIDHVDMIQFTAPISNGSSGGALLNMCGELIGISTAGLDAGQNINFAVDYQSIRNFTLGISGLM